MYKLFYAYKNKVKKKRFFNIQRAIDYMNKVDSYYCWIESKEYGYMFKKGVKL